MSKFLKLIPMVCCCFDDDDDDDWYEYRYRHRHYNQEMDDTHRMTGEELHAYYVHEEWKDCNL